MAVHSVCSFVVDDHAGDGFESDPRVPDASPHRHGDRDMWRGVHAG